MKFVYSPESYYVLTKMEYLNLYYQFDQSERDDEIALGGIYEIDFVEDEDRVHILPGNFVVKRRELVPFEPEKYNFKTGDLVKLNPRCDENQYFEIGGYFKIGKLYSVKRIINNYYLTLVNENGFEGNPVRFCDVDRKRGKLLDPEN